MYEDLKHLVTGVVQSPKFAVLIASLSNGVNWLLDNISPVFSTLTSIASFVLVIVLIRFHLANTRKILMQSQRIKERGEARSSEDA